MRLLLLKGANIFYYYYIHLSICLNCRPIGVRVYLFSQA